MCNPIRKEEKKKKKKKKKKKSEANHPMCFLKA